MTDDRVRASDADREHAVDRLRAAAAEGRLTPEELAERIDAAYGARTLGELGAVTSDLPSPGDRPAVATRRSSLVERRDVRQRLASFVAANGVCILIWLATGADGSFWPKWVLLGTGIALFVTVVHAAFGTRPDESSPSSRRRPDR